MELLWKVIVEVEKAKANHDGALRQLVAQVPVFHFTVLREIAIGLRQLEFQQVTLVAKETTETIVDGFCHTGVVKDVKGDSKNTRITRLRRWHGAVISDTMKQHRHNEVDIADVAGLLSPSTLARWMRLSGQGHALSGQTCNLSIGAWSVLVFTVNTLFWVGRVSRGGVQFSLKVPSLAARMTRKRLLSWLQLSSTSSCGCCGSGQTTATLFLCMLCRNMTDRPICTYWSLVLGLHVTRRPATNRLATEVRRSVRSEPVGVVK